ncbi:MAG TPA: glycosyl hydrolase, partial [Chitinophagaceae bacterium]|nr:glycosyl hydrolase [Chitinophagaceae bacterium]
ADFESIQQQGLQGVYVLPVKEGIYAPAKNEKNSPAGQQWTLLQFAMKEAKRLHLRMAMPVSNILSADSAINTSAADRRQQLVWTKNFVKTGTKLPLAERPQATDGYYKDIAVLAYPANSAQPFSDTVQVPAVITSTGARASFLCFEDSTAGESLYCANGTWVQYRYRTAFTCRAIRVQANAANARLLLQAGNDGQHFTSISTLEAPRCIANGNEAYTVSIPTTTARYFRFVVQAASKFLVNEKGVDTSVSIALKNIHLTDEPQLHHYEAKSGGCLRIADAVSPQYPSEAWVPANRVLDLTALMDSSGRLQWTAPPGNWVIVRIGHTAAAQDATHRQFDKMNAALVSQQVAAWYQQAFQNAPAPLAKELASLLRADSAAAEGQRWSVSLPAVLTKRLHYNWQPYLLTLTGVPVESSAQSEKFLTDLRASIAALIDRNYAAALKKMAQKRS